MAFDNLRGARYLSLATFRKDGSEVRTPVWFGESEQGVVVMTEPEMGKVKRMRRNPQVRVAPCTIRGAVTGVWRDGRVRFLEGDEAEAADHAIRRRYWLARLTLLWKRWKRPNTYFEITPA